MSMHPHPLEPIPEQTRRIALASFPNKSLIMRLRDELGDLYHDEDFACLFAKRGRAAESPWRLALVTIMQALEGLTDRQAADAVRGRLDWKYALSLSLEDAGFDFSILSEFRQRLSEQDGQALLLDPLLTLCRARGWLLSGGTQRTDSTHVLAAIRSLSSLESVGEAMRAALNDLAASAPDWLLAVMDPRWAERYVHRVDLVRLPKGEVARRQLKAQIGQDVQVLRHALHESETPASLSQLTSVQCLETIWNQHYEEREGKVYWRDGPAVSNAERIVSPYDPQARASRKRETEWVGYKVHLTETCPLPQEERPSLIVQVQTTAATVQDVEMTATILADVRQRGLAPERVVADSAYQSGELLVEQRRLGTDLSGPVGGSTSWQQRAQQGYSVAAFEVDWQAEQVTCPQGQKSVAWKTRADRRGKETLVVRFASGVCRTCAVREQCTHTKQGGRRLTLLPSAQQQALEARRCEQVTPEFQQQYAIRAGIEATLSHGVRVMGLRESRYRGQAKTHLQHVSVAVALNLVRLDQFLLRHQQGQPSKRTTAFERLSQRVTT
jgi:transposase